MLKSKYYLSILGLLLLAAIKNAQASCAFWPDSTYPDTSVQNLTIPLDNRTFSVPPDTPVGTVFYRQYMNTNYQFSHMRIACTSNTLYVFGQYVTLPRSLATGYTDVYQTNLSGIGVRFRYSNYNYPYSTLITTNSWISGPSLMTFYVEFIKTAVTISPGTLLASSLPTIEQAVGQTDSKVVVANTKMSGQFVVTTPTCNITPASASMTVPMGNYMSTDFSGVNSGTAWKNASIQLINCPQFYGKGNANNTTSSNISGVETQNALTANTWTLSLTPYNGVINAANGIMKIDEETGSATGVGIQLSSSESTSGIINLINGVTKSIVKDGSVTTITIPLYARYIQTENSVTAGKANGRLEYIITYQ